MIIMVIVITIVIIKISMLHCYNIGSSCNFFSKPSMNAFKLAPSCLSFVPLTEFFSPCVLFF